MSSTFVVSVMAPNPNSDEWDEDIIETSNDYDAMFQLWESTIHHHKEELINILPDPRIEIMIYCLGKPDGPADHLPYTWTYDDYNFQNEDEPLPECVETLLIPKLDQQGYVSFFVRCTEQEVVDLYRVFVAQTKIAIET